MNQIATKLNKNKNSKPPTPKSAKRNNQLKPNNKGQSPIGRNQNKLNPKTNNFEGSMKLLSRMHGLEFQKYNISINNQNSNIWPSFSNKNSRPSSSKSSKRGSSPHQLAAATLWRHRGSQKPYQSRLIPGKLKDLNSTTHRNKKVANNKGNENSTGYSKYIANKLKSFEAKEKTSLKINNSNERKTPALLKPITTKDISRNQYQNYDKGAKTFRQEIRHTNPKEYKSFSKFDHNEHQNLNQNKKQHNTKSKDK